MVVKITDTVNLSKTVPNNTTPAKSSWDTQLPWQVGYPYNSVKTESHSVIFSQGWRRKKLSLDRSGMKEWQKCCSQKPLTFISKMLNSSLGRSKKENVIWFNQFNRGKIDTIKPFLSPSMASAVLLNYSTLPSLSSDWLLECKSLKSLVTEQTSTKLFTFSRLRQSILLTCYLSVIPPECRGSWRLLMKVPYCGIMVS